MRDLVLRRMAAADLEAIVEVWVRSRWSAVPWIEARMQYTDEQNLGYFRDTVARENDVWVATQAGAIRGLMALGRGVIEQLYVEPAVQRAGIGTALLRKAMDLSPGGLTLFTHQRNERARAFYEGHGFRVVAFGVSPPPESEPDVKYAWAPAPHGDQEP